MAKDKINKENIKDEFKDIKKDPQNPDVFSIKDTEFDDYMRG